jgi:transcription elongation factor
LTRAAVASGTAYSSGNGGSWRSGDETPAWSTSGAIVIPRPTRAVINSAVNGRPALGISELPGTVAYTV